MLGSIVGLLLTLAVIGFFGYALTNPKWVKLTSGAYTIIRIATVALMLFVLAYYFGLFGHIGVANGIIRVQ